MKNEFDIVIVGAGPAGLTTAIKLAGSGLTIALIDKNEIPSNKVCGDALSGSVMDALKRLPGNLYEKFLSLPGITPSWGIRFYAPSGRWVDIPFLAEPDRSGPSPGYVCKRIEFDGLLAREAYGIPGISIFPETKVNDILVEKDGVVVWCEEKNYRAKMIVGADGANSLAGKLLAGHVQDHHKYCLGIRSYFRGVTNRHPENFIELHFIKELLPGYFWIFPMVDGISNIGMGMMYRQVKKESGSLLEKFNFLIRNHPLFSERFKNAELIGKPESHGLPMGPDKRPLSGNRFLLAGDAASLIDPFTGEGIGNAMISGEIAAEICIKAFQKGDFSASSLSAYDHQIREKLFHELRINSMISKLASSQTLFNRIVKKASENEEVRSMLTKMYSDENVRGELTNPGFYLRLFTK